jgi:WD40 repeat protein
VQPVSAIGFRSDDTLVVTDGSVIKTLNTASSVDGEWPVNGRPRRSVLSNSAGTLAFVTSSTIALISTSSGKQIGTISPRIEDKNDSLADVLFSPDDHSLLVATRHGASTIWDLTNFKVLAKKVERENDASGLSWSPDSGRVGQLDFDSYLVVWSAANGRDIAGRLTEGEWPEGSYQVGTSFLDRDTILVWAQGNVASVYRLSGHKATMKSRDEDAREPGAWFSTGMYGKCASIEIESSWRDSAWRAMERYGN